MKREKEISFARTLHGTPGRNRGNFHRHGLVLQPLVYLLLLLGHDIADAHDVCLLFKTFVLQLFVTIQIQRCDVRYFTTALVPCLMFTMFNVYDYYCLLSIYLL